MGEDARQVPEAGAIRRAVNGEYQCQWGESRMGRGRMSGERYSGRKLRNCFPEPCLVCTTPAEPERSTCTCLHIPLLALATCKLHAFPFAKVQLAVATCR